MSVARTVAEILAEHVTLEIERGTADDLEELAGRRLLLERYPQLAVADVELREQPHVLDGDHGLVGKRLKKGDLAICKWVFLESPNCEGADRLARADQRSTNEAPPQTNETWTEGQSDGSVTGSSGRGKRVGS